jgi:hypothetical protein
MSTITLEDESMRDGLPFGQKILAASAWPTCALRMNRVIQSQGIF